MGSRRLQLPKEMAVDGYEMDATTGWRRWYNWRAGKIKWIKRRMNKRFRKRGKQDLKGL